MGKLVLFLLLQFRFIIAITTSSCPIDLSYVETVPWDTSLCHQPNVGQCCITLLSLFGMGVAQHLKQTSMFQLPNSLNHSSACLSVFQSKLTSMSMDPSLVPLCFDDPNQFVANTSSCVGILTTQDWMRKVGPLITELDAACGGDFSGLTQCSSCLEAGQKVNSVLTRLDPARASKCFYFTCLYAAEIASQNGPLDPTTAACTLSLPFAPDFILNKNTSANNKLLRLVFGLLGALFGIILAFSLIIIYRRYDRKTVSDVPNLAPNSRMRWFSFIRTAASYERRKAYLRGISLDRAGMA